MKPQKLNYRVRELDFGVSSVKLLTKAALILECFLLFASALALGLAKNTVMWELFNGTGRLAIIHQR